MNSSTKLHPPLFNLQRLPIKMFLPMNGIVLEILFERKLELRLEQFFPTMGTVPIFSCHSFPKKTRFLNLWN